MGAMMGGGSMGGYQQPQYGQQSPQQWQQQQPQGGAQGPYSQQATMQNAQQQQAAMMQGFGGQQQQPMGKGGSFNAPNYQQLAGFAGGAQPGQQPGQPPQQGQPQQGGAGGQPSWLAAAQQAAQRTGMQQSDYQRDLAAKRGDGMSGQNFSDVMAIRNNQDQTGAVRARLAQSLGDPDAASATGYGQKSAQAINNYGAGGAYYDPQQSIVAARQAATDVRKRALRGG